MIARFNDFRERGLMFPLGIALGLGLMVVWNMFFIYMAVSTAPDVRADYTAARER